MSLTKNKTDVSFSLVVGQQMVKEPGVKGLVGRRGVQRKETETVEERQNKWKAKESERMRAQRAVHSKRGSNDAVSGTDSTLKKKCLHISAL